MGDDNGKKLAGFRARIDEIDNEIIGLLIRRIAVVKQVGELKHNTTNIPCPIRSGREAEMIRSIAERFSVTDFPAAAAAAIWRIIIGASTGVEAKLGLSVFTDEKENSLYWLAREYFGPASPIVKQSQINRVIGDVIDGKAAVGIVPFIRSSDTSNWWTVLMQQGENAPKIFAYIPFVYTDAPGKAAPSALAVARLRPEPSGDDMSLVVIEADANVSQSRLQTAFVNARLEATWLNIASLSPSCRHHLVEVKGFVDGEHEGFKAFASALGNSIFTTHFLGAYARPITVIDSQNT